MRYLPHLRDKRSYKDPCNPRYLWEILNIKKYIKIYSGYTALPDPKSYDILPTSFHADLMKG